MGRRFRLAGLTVLLLAAAAPADGPTREQRLATITGQFRSAKKTLQPDAKDDAVRERDKKALEALEKTADADLTKLVTERPGDGVSLDALWFGLTEAARLSDRLPKLLFRHHLDNPRLVELVQNEESFYALFEWTQRDLCRRAKPSTPLWVVSNTMLAELCRWRRPADTDDLCERLLADPATKTVRVHGRPAADLLRAYRFSVRNLQCERPFPDADWTTTVGRPFSVRKALGAATLVVFLDAGPENEAWAKQLLDWAGPRFETGLRVVLVADFAAERPGRLAKDRKLADKPGVTLVPVKQPGAADSVAERWGVRPAGAGYFLDATGMIRAQLYPGFDDHDRARVEAVLAEPGLLRADPKRAAVAFGFDGVAEPGGVGFADVLAAGVAPGKNTDAEKLFGGDVDGKPTPVLVHRLADLRVTSGRIAGLDGHIVSGDEAVFDRAVPAGKYPLRLAVAARGTDRRVAFARVEFGPAPAVKWELAKLVDRAGGGEARDTYGVDVGTGGFADAAFLAKLKARPDTAERYKKRADRAINNTYRYSWSWYEGRVDGEQIVVFSSGVGDGSYRSYWGFDKGGKLVALMTDFGLVKWAMAK